MKTSKSNRKIRLFAIAVGAGVAIFVVSAALGSEFLGAVNLLAIFLAGFVAQVGILWLLVKLVIKFFRWVTKK